MLKRTKSSRLSTGTAMLEFALILPMFLFLITFAVDMGRLTFYSGILKDAAFSSARAGAQVGGAGGNASGTSRTAFYDALSAITNNPAANGTTYTVVSGGTCTKNRSGTVDNRYVQINTSFRLNFVTPGLSTLVGVARGQNASGFTLHATGVARCEVVK